MMKNRKASDRMSECIIDMLHENRHTIKRLNHRIDMLIEEKLEQKKRAHIAQDLAITTSDKLEEIADIIAGITEYKDGSTQIFLSDIQPANGSKLNRLFTLLDIPMTAEQIKEGDIIDKD